MLTLAGVKKNSVFGGVHTTAIDGSKKFFKALASVGVQHKVFLGFITNNARNKKIFVKCTIFMDCLEFKLGFTGVQTITVITGAVTPEHFLGLLQKKYRQHTISIVDMSQITKAAETGW